MRLAVVEYGHPPFIKFMMRVYSLFSGARAPDIMRTLTYRPEIYGKAANAWLQGLLRGPSDTWTVGERELFAAFTSRLNECPF